MPLFKIWIAKSTNEVQSGQWPRSVQKQSVLLVTSVQHLLLMLYPRAHVAKSDIEEVMAMSVSVFELRPPVL